MTVQSGWWCVASMSVLLPMAAVCAPQPASPAAGGTRLMTSEDLGALRSQPPDRRITYGAEPSHYGELRRDVITVSPHDAS